MSMNLKSERKRPAAKYQRPKANKAAKYTFPCYLIPACVLSFLRPVCIHQLIRCLGGGWDLRVDLRGWDGWDRSRDRSWDRSWDRSSWDRIRNCSYGSLENPGGHRTTGVGIHTEEHRTVDSTSVGRGIDVGVPERRADFLELGLA